MTLDAERVAGLIRLAAGHDPRAERGWAGASREELRTLAAWEGSRCRLGRREARAVELLAPVLASSLRAEARPTFTPAEARVAELVEQGLTDVEVASVTRRRLPTVRAHLRRVSLELGVSRREARQSWTAGRRNARA